MFSTFDIISYLQDREIEYWTEGKNVTVGWTNIQCPFCEDHSNHCGISPTRFFNCYLCGEKGSVIKLITEIDSCNKRKAIEIIKQFQEYGTEINEEIRSNECELPKEVVDKFPKIHIKYLEKRGFNAKEIIKKYDLHAVHTLGKFKGRIIIPYYLNKEIVTFSSRSIHDSNKIKYKHCSKEKSIFPPKELLYNIDNCKNDTLVICEGPIDVWKIGDDSCCLSGIQFTEMQVLRIINGKFKKVFILFDGEDKVIKQIDKLIGKLSGFIKYIEPIYLRSGDPGDLKQEDIRLLRKELKI